MPALHSPDIPQKASENAAITRRGLAGLAFSAAALAVTARPAASKSAAARDNLDQLQKLLAAHAEIKARRDLLSDYIDDVQARGDRAEEVDSEIFKAVEVEEDQLFQDMWAISYQICELPCLSLGEVNLKAAFAIRWLDYFDPLAELDGDMGMLLKSMMAVAPVGA